MGKATNRNINFLDGTYIDRDLLASINIAIRNKKGKKKQEIKGIKIPQKRRTKLTKSKKQEILDKIKTNRNVEIVAFQPSQALALSEATCKSLNTQIVYTSCLSKGLSVSKGYKYNHL